MDRDFRRQRLCLTTYIVFHHSDRSLKLALIPRNAPNSKRQSRSWKISFGSGYTKQDYSTLNYMPGVVQNHPGFFMAQQYNGASDMNIFDVIAVTCFTIAALRAGWLILTITEEQD